jgi:hypothetical protein
LLFRADAVAKQFFVVVQGALLAVGGVIVRFQAVVVGGEVQFKQASVCVCTRRSSRRLGGLWAVKEMVDVNSVNIVKSVNSFWIFFHFSGGQFEERLCKITYWKWWKWFFEWPLMQGPVNFLV